MCNPIKQKKTMRKRKEGVKNNKEKEKQKQKKRKTMLKNGRNL